MTQPAIWRKTLRALTWWAVAGVCAASCAACSSNPDADFNTVIPDIIKEARGDPVDQSIRDLVNTASPDAQRAAIQSIQDKPWGHDPGCMKAYRTLSASPSPMVRGQAMRALASSHSCDVEVADVLLRGLADADPGVRRDASQALVDIRNPVTIPAMLDHLANPDEEAQVRINLARALKGYNVAKVLRAWRTRWTIPMWAWPTGRIAASRKPPERPCPPTAKPACNGSSSITRPPGPPRRPCVPVDDGRKPDARTPF